MPYQSRNEVQVRAIGVARRYRSVQALEDVTLTFGSGTTAILGRNGAGKSSLVRIIVGVDRASAGEVEVVDGGVTVGRRERLRKIGWLPQSFGFPSGMRVADFLAYAAWLKEVPREANDEAVERALEFADLRDVARKKMRELSGGTLRRVGLGAAVVHSPAVLILDEPTAGLDPIQRAEFHAKVAQYAESATVLLATHILEDVHAMASPVHVLDHGRVLWSGDVEGLSRLATSGAVGVDALRDGLITLVGVNL
ncbi:MAG: ATP-binding cassette domain-containing protein [Marmoricola sp.]